MPKVTIVAQVVTQPQKTKLYNNNNKNRDLPMATITISHDVLDCQQLRESNLAFAKTLLVNLSSLHKKISQLTANINRETTDYPYLQANVKVIADLKKKLQEAVENYDPKNEREDFLVDYGRHTVLWKDSKRYGADDITTETREAILDPKKNSCFFVDLKKKLNAILKHKRLWPTGDEDLITIYANIRNTLADNESARVRFKRIFLNTTRLRLADQILDRIKHRWPEKLVSDPECTKIIGLVQDIRKLSGDEDIKAERDSRKVITCDLQTRDACLSAHAKVVKLERLFKRFYTKHQTAIYKYTWEKFQEKDHTLNLMKPFTAVTKRWIDVYYENPKKLSLLEKIRYYIKLIGTTNAFLMAIIALICVFAAPAVVPYLGICALTSMLLYVDNFFDMTRSVLFYRRSPQVSQMKELALLVPLVILLAFGMYGLAGLAGALVGSSLAIFADLGKAVYLLTDLISRYSVYVAKGFSVFANYVMSSSLVKNMKSYNKEAVTTNPTEKPTATYNEALALLKKQYEGTAEVTSFKVNTKTIPSDEMLVFVSGTKVCVAVPTYRHQIEASDISTLSVEPNKLADVIKKHQETYASLPSTESLTNRYKVLTDLRGSINKWMDAHVSSDQAEARRKPKVNQLHLLVEQERNNLRSILLKAKSGNPKTQLPKEYAEQRKRIVCTKVSGAPALA